MKKRIIVLDQEDVAGANFRQLDMDAPEGVEFETIYLSFLTDRFTFDASEVVEFRNLIRRGGIDLIVVGNNMGAGLARLGMMRQYIGEIPVIVVWTGITLPSVVGYQSLGYRNFCLWARVGEKIFEVLGIKAEAEPAEALASITS